METFFQLTLCGFMFQVTTVISWKRPPGVVPSWLWFISTGVGIVVFSVLVAILKEVSCGNSIGDRLN